MRAPAEIGRGLAARLAERLARRHALRVRRPPAIRTTEASAAGSIYYLCPDYAVPSGGIRAMYRHVDILNRAGLEAAVMHRRDGFACRWFEHSTRIVGAPSVTLSRQDVLVVPEIYGPFLDRLPRTPRLVAFSQNAYLTYEHLPPGVVPPYDLFESAMTVSEDSAACLRFAFPGLDPAVVPNAIDSRVFHPDSGLPPRRLALMPRKRPAEADQILRLLGDRLRGWEVVRIEGVPEGEAASALRAAPIFLALGRQEGFGLPAAEAMASGCYVVGFPAFGGRELFDPACSAPVEDGDTLAAARALAAAMELYETRPEAVRASGARAAERVRCEYSPERQAAALLSFFAGLGLSPEPDSSGTMTARKPKRIIRT